MNCYICFCFYQKFKAAWSDFFKFNGMLSFFMYIFFMISGCFEDGCWYFLMNGWVIPQCSVV